MDAVWRELSGRRIEHKAAIEAMALVASRLYTGFSVSLSRSGDVVLKPEKITDWTVSLQRPEIAHRLPEECIEWLRADLKKIRPQIQELLTGVPPEALRWSSESFKSHLDSLVENSLPGWHVYARMLVRGNEAELELNFSPTPPLMLAVNVETLSATIPQLLADTISDRTLEQLSPLTGFPLKWLEHHKESFLVWLRTNQLDNNWLHFLRAEADNEINLKPITKITSHIDSTTYSLRAWVSGHAGNEARLQAGLHLGHFFSLSSAVPAEIYSELILGLEHWQLDARLGLRFSPFRYFWLGIEGSTEDEESLWYRAFLDFAKTGFYSWIRYGRHTSREMALGYRLNRYISLELFYEKMKKDRFSLRALANL